MSRCLAALLLLMIPVAAMADAPRHLARSARVVEVATLNHADALCLARTALYRVEVDSRAEEYKASILVDCASLTPHTARLLRGSSVRGRGASVWGRLHVVRHPASWGFPSWSSTD